MIAVFASGQGTNFDALINALPDISFHLICNEPKAGVLNKAKKQNIPIILCPHNEYSTRESHEVALFNATKHLSLNLLVLAGYMRIFSPKFFELFQGTRVINLHPAPLEAYQGPHGYKRAVESKSPYWKISVHDVIPKLDAGPIIATETLPVFPYETPESLRQRAQYLEHKLLINAVRKIVQKE